MKDLKSLVKKILVFRSHPAVVSHCGLPARLSSGKPA